MWAGPAQPDGSDSTQRESGPIRPRRGWADLSPPVHPTAFCLGQTRPDLNPGQHRSGPWEKKKESGEGNYFPLPSLHAERNIVLHARGQLTTGKEELPGVEEAVAGGAAVSWLRGRRRCGCSQAAERERFCPLPFSSSFSFLLSQFVLPVITLLSSRFCFKKKQLPSLVFFVFQSSLSPLFFFGLLSFFFLLFLYL